MIAHSWKRFIALALGLLMTLSLFSGTMLSVRAEETETEETTLVSDTENTASSEETENTSVSDSTDSIEKVTDQTEENTETEENAGPLKAVFMKAEQIVTGNADAYFDASITTQTGTSITGGMATNYTVTYNIERGKIHAGDYITVTVPDAVASVKLAVPDLHFSKVETEDNRNYRLTFADGIENGLTGYMTLTITAREVENTVNGMVTVGSAEKELTVVGVTRNEGTGTYTDTISKEYRKEYRGEGWSDPSISQAEYAEDPESGWIMQGIMNWIPEGNDIAYRIYINQKQGSISNVTVTDAFPQGMSLEQDSIRVTYNDNDHTAVDSSLYSLRTSSDSFTFAYPGELNGTVLYIEYRLQFNDGEQPMISEYMNRSEITYDENAETKTEHAKVNLMGSSCGAASGYKSVDKTEIGTDPRDQIVTYSVAFLNQNGFKAGEINLYDHLDQYVQYKGLTEDSSRYFSVECSGQDVHIVNTADIPSSSKQVVSFRTDFTNVPTDYTVSNRINNGNVVKTEKKASAALKASKTVDGSVPSADQKFSFSLKDAQRNLISETENSGSEILFDSLKYTEADLNGKDSADFTYYISENTGDTDAYTFDQNEYKAVVTLSKESGALTTDVNYYDAEGNRLESAPVFANTTVKPEPRLTDITFTKIWKDNSDALKKRPEKITVDLISGTETLRQADVKGTGDTWTFTFEDLPVSDENGSAITYIVREHETENYTSSGDASSANHFTITNTVRTESIPWTELTPSEKKEETPAAPAEEKTTVIPWIDLIPSVKKEETTVIPWTDLTPSVKKEETAPEKEENTVISWTDLTPSVRKEETSVTPDTDKNRTVPSTELTPSDQKEETAAENRIKKSLPATNLSPSDNVTVKTEQKTGTSTEKVRPAESTAVNTGVSSGVLKWTALLGCAIAVLAVLKKHHD